MSGNTLALTGARIFTGEAMLDGHAVIIADGRIAAVARGNELPAGLRRRALPEGALLAPGFIDTQVNGGGDVLFNDTPDLATIRRIISAHRRFGTTGLLPTLITDVPEKMRAALAAGREALALGVPGMLGLHLEGPFINPARKGVHDARHMRLPDAADMAALTAPFPGKLLVTLAPELMPDGVIQRLSAAGVIVSIGHSDARAGQFRAAAAAGATAVTHLFNAMSQITSREPGVAGAALHDQRLYCGIIADLLTVDPINLALTFKARPLHRCVLVTDAMPTLGGLKDRFMLVGREVILRDGKLLTADGTLAGAHLDMAGAVRNVMTLGVALEDALRMASRNPAALLGLDHELGFLKPGCRADIVALDEKLDVITAWIGGEE